MKKKLLIGLGLPAIGVLTLFAQPALINTTSLIANTWASLTTEVLTVTGASTLPTISGATASYTTVNANSSFRMGGPTATTIIGIFSTNAVVDFGAINTNVSANLTFTVPGATTNGAVAWSIAAPHPSFVYYASVTAPDTVTFTAANISITNAINQAATVGRFTVIQY